MDAISALHVASDILTVTGLSIQLLSGPDTPETLLKDELTILELASFSLEDTGRLIEAVEAIEAIGGIPKDFLENRPQPWDTDTRALVQSTVERILSLDKTLTSIVGFGISELNKIIESFGDTKLHTKPEHESRIDSIARDLENLRLEVQKRSVNLNMVDSAALTKTDIRLLSDRQANLTEAGDNMFSERIVPSLNYASRPVRHDSVPQAHKNTFQWAFDSRLSKWLISGSGTFWISGKPGSGKSTFVKFIARHPRTKALLTRWAGSADTLAVAVHFFWIAGTAIQKSWQGLLKSLLFDVCHKHPSVSVFELTAALRALASADNMPLKCDHTELCKVLSDMANSPYIKMCVSSRPWAVFERSFGGESKNGLDIHELTRNDIQKWTTEESAMTASGKSELIEQIVTQADGVFLWALFMAGILQAADHALEPLHIDLYWQLERELEEYGHVYECLIRSGPPEQVSTQRAQTVHSINENTKGLLKFVDIRVEFLHRTYLRSKPPNNHNGFLSIATAYLGYLKTTCQDNSLVARIMRHGKGLNSGPFISHLNQALIYASETLKADQCDSHNYQRTMVLLDKYEVAVEAMACNDELPFREEILKHNLTPYLRKNIHEQPDFFGIFDESPLFATLTPMALNSGESPAPVVGTLEILLQRGEDPNVLPRVRAPGLFEPASPWIIFSRGTMSNESLNNALFDLLMSYGADPNQTLLDRRGAHTVFSHFLKIFASRLLGEECFDGYLRALDAFFRAGASLGVPYNRGIDLGSDYARGNLARSRPDESILASHCTEFNGLMTRLASDPGRARFLSSVVEKLNHGPHAIAAYLRVALFYAT
ncbi:hypothetical protein F4810DRAFT_704891 [Camillea tinctor]|nr:hypothetical protein F4810DRAFT_704891 [Camillea tinctor]